MKKPVHERKFDCWGKLVWSNSSTSSLMHKSKGLIREFGSGGGQAGEILSLPILL